MTIHRCDTVREGVRCSGIASHVYRAAWATRLICDDCVKMYIANRLGRLT